MTAYAGELQEIERELARLEQVGDRLPLLRQRYLRACLTADFSDLQVVEREIEHAISALGLLADLVLAKAGLEIRLHRPDAAQQTLETAPYLRQTPAGRSLLADIALQMGRYAEARAALEAAVDEGSDWEGLARLAYFRSMTGEPDSADWLYAEAQELLTAKEMRHYAWLELQRGIIDLNVGRYEAALSHYRHADRAYSGYWLIEEHMAEVLALLGHSDESAEIYTRVVRSTNKPELMAAQAGVIAERDPEYSAELRRFADEIFERQMALYPQAAVGHYLSYLIDSTSDTDRLIELARLNAASRPNTDSKVLLAQAYIKAGMAQEARSVVMDAATSPWRAGELDELLRSLRVDAR